MHQYVWKKFRTRLNLFRIRTKFRTNLFQITVYFFLTDTCLAIIKSSGTRKFCQNNKFPDKSSAGLTRSDCRSITGIHALSEYIYSISSYCIFLEPFRLKKIAIKYYRNLGSLKIVSEYRINACPDYRGMKAFVFPASSY